MCAIFENLFLGTYNFTLVGTSFTTTIVFFIGSRTYTQKQLCLSRNLQYFNLFLKM